MNNKRPKWIFLALALLLIAGLVVWCTRRENCKSFQDGSQVTESRMCTDKERYRFGEAVHVSFRITNISDHSLEFGDGSGPAMDICGPWQRCWSDGRELTDEQKHFVLRPGESRTLEWTWPPSLTYVEEEFATLHGGRAVPLDLRGCEAYWDGDTYCDSYIYISYGRP
jgi:hypothetical protein